MKKILYFLFTTIFFINPTNAIISSKNVNDVSDTNLVTIGMNWDKFKLFNGKLEPATYYNYDSNLDIQENYIFITNNDSTEEQGAILDFLSIESNYLDDSEWVFAVASEIFEEEFFKEYSSKNKDYYDFNTASELLIRPIADLMRKPNEYNIYVVSRNLSARTHLVIISKVNDEALLLTNDFYKDLSLK